MRPLLTGALGAALLFAGCSGSTTPAVPRATVTGATGTTTLAVRVPTRQVAAVSSVARSAQFISSGAAGFYVDLQGDPTGTYQYSLALDTTHCTADSGGATSTCTYALAFPVGSDTISIAAWGPTAYGTPPALVGYAKTTVAVTAGANPGITVALSALALAPPTPTLQYGVIGSNPGGDPTSTWYPYFRFPLSDAYGSIPESAFLPSVALQNPIDIYSNDPRGQIALATLYNCGQGCHGDDVIGFGPAIGVEISGTDPAASPLAGLDGVEIDDFLSPPFQETFTITFLVPTFTVTSAEFSQINNFIGEPQNPGGLLLWSGGGGTTAPMNLTCTPPTGTATSPCTQNP